MVISHTSPRGTLSRVWQRFLSVGGLSDQCMQGGFCLSCVVFLLYGNTRISTIVTGEVVGWAQWSRCLGGMEIPFES